MRDCCVIITSMINLIPKDKVKFISDLEWNYEDASYKAPEERIQWHRTQETLVKHMPEPTEDWEFEVLSIFTTQPIDALRQSVKES